MGKAKFINLCKANKKTSFKGSFIVNYASYSSLAKYINEIDIGTLNNITNITDECLSESIQGVYRNPAEHILRLASFYLEVNKIRLD